jgi:hypothetical protein
VWKIIIRKGFTVRFQYSGQKEDWSVLSSFKIGDHARDHLE